MPGIQPIFMREAALLAKIETTAGTDAAPLVANFIKVKDFSLMPLEGDEIEYAQIQPYFGNFDSEMVTTQRKLDCTVYLAGSGVAGTAPNFDPLLQICGTSVTIVATTSATYAPITRAVKTATLYMNIGGTNYRMTNTRGTAVVTCDEKGYPVIKFSLQGLYMPLVSAALPAVGGSASAKAVPINATNTTLSIHTIALRASAFSLDFGNQVGYRNRIGYEDISINDRKSTYSTTFEAVDVATKNWEAAAIASTTGAISLVHGLTAGNRVTIASAKANVGKPSISDSDGVKMNSFSGRLIPSTAGNDEWSIAFT